MTNLVIIFKTYKPAKHILCMATEDATRIGTHRNGRPTCHKSHQIEAVIQDYFIKGVSAEFVIKDTGLNKNTVYGKFKELSDMIRRTDEKDFAEKYEEEKIQHIVSIDHLILKTYKILSYVEDAIKKHHDRGREIPEFLFQTFCDITKHLLNLKKEKASYVMKPSFDEDLKNKIKEVVENLESN